MAVQKALEHTRLLPSPGPALLVQVFGGARLLWQFISLGCCVGSSIHLLAFAAVCDIRGSPAASRGLLGPHAASQAIGVLRGLGLSGARCCSVAWRYALMLSLDETIGNSVALGSAPMQRELTAACRSYTTLNSRQLLRMLPTPIQTPQPLV